ncbi:hypothetical protein [Streptomyces aureus]|uniref:hypothetical protein n=1 Tax=Streptomyces aureus TaxID=193461 RepID=UPI003406CCEB
MSDRGKATPAGPGAGPGTWLLGMALLGLLMVTPGVAVGYFEGFQDDTEAGAFAWLMMVFGGLLTASAGLAALVRRVAPRQKQLRRRRAAELRSLQAPLAATELTRASLLAAVVPPEPVPRWVRGPRPPATDAGGRLIWWRDRDLLQALGLPGLAAGTAGAGILGLCGVLHILDAGEFRGWLFLVFSALGLFFLTSDIRVARVLARAATVDGHVHEMNWLLLHEPEDGEAYLVLHPVGDDPDAAGPWLLRLADKEQALRLAPTGVAEVHGRLESVTLVVPWIDGAPVWTRSAVKMLDLTNEADRARLTYLLGTDTADR